MAARPITNDNKAHEGVQNFSESFILKVLEDEFGQTAAHCIISHVARTTLKSRSEILSNFDTFSRILKQVYTEDVAEKEILNRLTNLGLGKSN